MSGIYLPNAQIPNGGCLIVTGGNENMLVEVVSKDNVLLKEFFAIPVPDHGRLIDADALEDEGADVHEDVICCGYVEDTIWGFSHDMVRNAPTVIPADNAPRPDDPRPIDDNNAIHGNGVIHGKLNVQTGVLTVYPADKEAGE